MAQDDQTPLDYRRYAAMTRQLVITKPTQEPSASENIEKPASQESAAEPVQPPVLPARQFEALKEKLTVNIDDAKTLTEFIKLGYELGEYEIIIAFMKDYLARKGRDTGIRFNLAMTLLRTGDKKKAKFHFRKILSHNQKHQQARAMLERLRNVE